MGERMFKDDIEEISDQQIRDEVLRYMKKMEAVVGRKQTLKNKAKALADARKVIGQIDIESPDYAIGFFKLRVLDELGIQLTSGVEFAGSGLAGSEGSRRYSHGPERRRRTPKF